MHSVQLFVIRKLSNIINKRAVHVKAEIMLKRKELYLKKLTTYLDSNAHFEIVVAAFQLLIKYFKFT